jgi:subtilisin-like proprotein convertase family protein
MTKLLRRRVLRLDACEPRDMPGDLLGAWVESFRDDPTTPGFTALCAEDAWTTNRSVHDARQELSKPLVVKSAKVPTSKVRFGTSEVAAQRPPIFIPSIAPLSIATVGIADPSSTLHASVVFITDFRSLNVGFGSPSLTSPPINEDASLTILSASGRESNPITAAQSVSSPTSRAPGKLVAVSDGHAIGLSVRQDRIAFAGADSQSTTFLAQARSAGLTHLRNLGASAAVFEGANAATITFANATTIPVFTNATSNRDSVVIDEVIINLKSGVDAVTFFSAPQFAGFRQLNGSDTQYVGRLHVTGADAVRASNDLARDPRVEWSEPNFYDDIERMYLPNDPLIGNQWPIANSGASGGIADADADLDEAWDLSPGGTTNRLVSIVDDGMELAHPDLNIWTNPGEVAGNNIDDDANGYVDDVNGWNFVSNTPAVQHSGTDRHGTAVAGITAARGDNAVGVAGASYKARVMGVRIFEGANSPDNANLASAIYYAAGRTANGLGSFATVSVMNNSWGGNGLNAAVQSAFAWATVHGRAGLGTATFAATGNGGSPTVIYPAQYSLSNTGLVGVGASTNLDLRASFSEYGQGLDIMAPSNGGTLGITTTDRLADAGYVSGDYYNAFGGTSAATPLASGIAALLISQAESMNVSLTAANVRSILQNSTDLIGGASYDTATGRNQQFGTGRINAATALKGVGQATLSAISTTKNLAAGDAFDPFTAPLGGTQIQSIRLRNAGTSTLNLSSFGTSGNTAFSIESISRTQIPLGESAILKLRYAPATAGAAAGLVSFVTNDPANLAFTLQLSGTTTAAPNIAGVVYEDRDGNAVKDSADAPLAGRTVFLDTNANGTLDHFTQFKTANLAIPDGSFGGVSSSIAVSGLVGAVSNVTIGVNITHPYIGDLVLALTAPSGNIVTLAYNAGDNGQNYTNTVFDDAASVPISAGVPPMSGRFKPLDSLAVLNGTTPNGTWSLTVADLFGGDIGTLVNWSLDFDSERTTTTDSQGAFQFTGLTTGTYTVAQVTPAGWAATTPPSTITLASAGDSKTGIALGSAKANRVYGQVWNDLNADGVKSLHEPGIPGRTLFADLNSDGIANPAMTTTVSKTANLPIPDNSLTGIASSLAVSGQTGTITDVDVTVNVRHNAVGDLRLTLISPSGVNVPLVVNRGRLGTTFISTTFDDQATLTASTMQEGQAPFTLSFIPETLLGTLNGATANGTWQLKAIDSAAGSTGTLESWSLTVRSGTAEPTATTDAIGNYFLDLTAGTATLTLDPLAGFKFTNPATGKLAVTAAGAPLYGKAFGVAENVPPTVSGLVVNDGASQRSRVSAVTVTFSEHITFTGSPAAAITVTGPGGTVPASIVLDDSGAVTKATLTFTGGPVPDGKYNLAIDAAQLKDIAQNALSPTAPLPFFRLLGDFSGDGTVNGADVLEFGNAFGSSPGNPAFRLEADFDNDGTIAGTDFLILGNRFGISI